MPASTQIHNGNGFDFPLMQQIPSGAQNTDRINSNGNFLALLNQSNERQEFRPIDNPYQQSDFQNVESRSQTASPGENERTAGTYSKSYDEKTAVDRNHENLNSEDRSSIPEKIVTDEDRNLSGQKHASEQTDNPDREAQSSEQKSKPENDLEMSGRWFKVPVENSTSELERINLSRQFAHRVNGPGSEQNGLSADSETGLHSKSYKSENKAELSEDILKELFSGGLSQAARSTGGTSTAGRIDEEISINNEKNRAYDFFRLPSSRTGEQSVENLQKVFKQFLNSDSDGLKAAIANHVKDQDRSEQRSTEQSSQNRRNASSEQLSLKNEASSEQKGNRDGQDNHERQGSPEKYVRLQTDERYSIKKANNSQNPNMAARVEISGSDFRSQLEQNVTESRRMQSEQNADLRNRFRDLVDRARFEVQQEGRSRATIQLRPEQLGRLTLDIRVENQNVTARVFVDNDAARKLLREEMDNLVRDLRAQGINVESLSIRVRETAQTHSYQQENMSDRSTENSDTGYDDASDQNREALNNSRYDEIGSEDFSENSDAIDEYESTGFRPLETGHALNVTI